MVIAALLGIAVLAHLVVLIALGVVRWSWFATAAVMPSLLSSAALGLHLAVADRVGSDEVFRSIEVVLWSVLQVGAVVTAMLAGLIALAMRRLLRRSRSGLPVQPGSVVSG